MALQSPRPRSNTSASTSASTMSRPKSRQSTTSVQSNAAHQAQLYHQTSEPIFQVQQQPPMIHHATPEEKVARQLSQSNSGYAIDPTLQYNHNQAQPAHKIINNSGVVDSPALQNDSNERRASVPPVRQKASPLQDEIIGDGDKRKKGSTSSQANDIELRRLYRENQGRDLHEVALQVIRDDKGPKSEKSKQIFGMLWLSSHCKRSTSCVPRNRVFSSYATRCGTELVPPLNPASFGKLIRIIFPGIQTRRLGVRGQSKYHYVELSLDTETSQQDHHVPQQRAESEVVDRYTPFVQEDPSNSNLRQQLPGDTSLFPTPDSPLPSSLPITSSRLPTSSSSLYLQPVQNGNNARSHRPAIICRPLEFPNPLEPSTQSDDQLQLPSIAQYLPAGADSDAVNSLTSVYRSHCLLAIDNFRFCKTEKLCDSYKALVGLLTVPGQKLLANPRIAAWIRECDWLKYQRMVPMLDKVLLTQVPRKAMAHMEHVALNICHWISHFFQNQPQHILDAMLGPANVFVSILERFLRVNRAALDVGSVLESVENRDQLWHDWVAHVNPHHVIQNALDQHGHTRIFHILTQDVRHLLTPLGTTALLGDGTMFEAPQSPTADPSDPQPSPLERLSIFLTHLPSRFPRVPARALLQHIDIIGNSISRNLTLNGAPSLGNWWRIKLFIDELAYYLAEKGGFLAYGPASMFPPARPKSRDRFSGPGFDFDAASDFATSRPRTAASVANQAPRHSFSPPPPQHGLPDDDNGFGPRPPTRHSAHSVHEARGQLDARVQQVEDGTKIDACRSRREDTVEAEGMGGVSVHDDSGIGMGLDDEFGLDGRYDGFVGGVHGSDPADVVVC